MNKKYVVSRKLAKRMQKLGWKKKTAFGWYLTGNRKRKIWQLLSEYPDKSEALLEFYSAPLSAEIWEELPNEIKPKDRYYFLTVIKNSIGQAIILYANNRGNDQLLGTWDILITTVEINEDAMTVSLSEVAGEIWCWCKENGYIKEEE